MKKPLKIEKSLFLTKARKDEKIERLLRITKKGTYVVNTNEMLNELEQLHSARVHRNVNPSNIMSKTRQIVSEWVAENNSYRGRAVTIMMRAVRVQRKIQEHINDARNYLGAEYGGFLHSEFSTENGKKRAVDTVLDDLIKKDHRLDTVIMVAKLLIEDLDKSAWNISYINEVSKIEFQHERHS